MQSKDANAHRLLGDVFGQLDEGVKAVTHYRRSIEIKPSQHDLIIMGKVLQHVTVT